MTTDIHMISALDLSVQNEVMVLSQDPLGIVMAGVSWTVIGLTPYDSMLLVTTYVVNLIANTQQPYELWLFVGNSAWQPDSRIVRYHKIWGALKARGIEVPSSNCLLDNMLESKGNVKFFGAAKLHTLSVETASKIFLEERCTYLVALPREIEPRDTLKIEWSGDVNNDYDLINSIVLLSGILFKQIGEFDDYERGLVAVGQTDLIENIFLKQK